MTEEAKGSKEESPEGLPAAGPVELARERRHPRWHALVDKATMRLRARKYRRRRIILGIMAALLAALVGAYSYVTRDAQIERLAEDYLSKLFHAKVDIRGARFTFFGGVSLDYLSVNLPGAGRPIFTANRVRLVHDRLSLLGGQLQIREIDAIQPHIDLEQQDKAWNFERLFAAEGAEQAGPRQRPVIYVEDGSLTIRRLQDGVQVYEHTLQLSGVVLPGRKGIFHFSAVDLTSGKVRGNITDGMIDVDRHLVSFEALAANVELTEELARTLPPEARQVWNRFSPQGSVNLKVAFRQGRADDEDFGLTLEANLNGVSLAYEQEGRKFVLENLTGQCLISRKGLLLRNVQGVLGQVPAAGAEASGETQDHVNLAVTLSGWLTGLDKEQLGQDLTVTVDDLDLARVRALASELSPQVQRFYQNFEPSGRVDVALQLFREPLPEAVRKISGSIKLREGRCVPWWFPYPVEQLSATFRLTPEQLEIQNLKGRQGGAEITMPRGLVKNLGPEAEVHLEMVAQGLTLDAQVRQALELRFPGFMPTYNSLHPMGLVDARVTVDRPAGPDRDVGVVTEVDLRGTEILYDGFPYRLADGHGRLIIKGWETEIEATGRHGDSDLDIRGRITGSPVGTAVALDINGRDVRLDEDLEKALPAEQQAIYKSYHPTGRADMMVKVACNAETGWQVKHDATIDLKNAGIIFEDFPYPIEGIWGRFEIHPGIFILKELRGTNASAAISASGRVEWTGQAYAMDLELRGSNVLLDRDLRGALSLNSQQIWSDLRPEGRVDVVCQLKKAGEAGSQLQTLVTLQARDVSLFYRYFPYPVQHARGQLVFDGSRATISNLEGTNGAARIQVSGVVETQPSGGIKSHLTIRGSAVTLNDELLKALPEAFAKPMAALAPQGQLNVNLEQLTYDVDPQGAIAATWKGSAVIDDGAMTLGHVPVDRLVAYVNMSGSFAKGRMSMWGMIEVPQGRIATKEVTNLRADFIQVSPAQHITITNIEGESYGGRLEGGGDLVIGAADPRYQVSVLVQDVAFERFVREALGIRSQVSGGQMAGEFILRGTGADPALANARGEFRITDAKLFQLPGFVQLLNTLGFKGDQTTFKEAEISILIHNNTYYFEKLLLKGRGLTLSGAGRMDDQGQLDLIFTAGDATRGGPLTALDDLARGLGREMLLVEVTGTLNDPKIETRSFSTLTAPFRELLRVVDKNRDLKAKKQATKAAKAAAALKEQEQK
jgi:hypothetical protein